MGNSTERSLFALITFRGAQAHSKFNADVAQWGKKTRVDKWTWRLTFDVYVDHSIVFDVQVDLSIVFDVRVSHSIISSVEVDPYIYFSMSKTIAS